MDKDHEHYHEERHGYSWWRTLPGIVCIFMLVVVGYIVYIDHRQHINEALPWLILLICPVMHLFMHHGHDSHHPHDKNKRDEKEDE